MNILKKILEERWLYYLGWAGFAVGLAMGRAIISVSVIVLACSWLFDGLYRKDLGEKWKSFLSNRPALLISSIPILYTSSWLYSTGIESGFKLLDTQTPLLILPLVFSTMPRLNSGQIRNLALLHIGALLLSTGISYFSADAALISQHPRKISIYVNHIRLSLLLVMGVVLLFRFFWSTSILKNTAIVLISLWFIYFQWIQESATGFVVLMILIFFSGVRLIWKKEDLRFIGIGFMAIVFGGLFWVGNSAQEYFKEEVIDISKLEKTTALGNLYTHNLENKTQENGNRIFMYLAYDEMHEAWEDRSSTDPLGKDAKGQLLSGTLIRYLSSLGLRKDAEGVAALSDAQIHDIELGQTSAIRTSKSGLGKRMEKIFFELDAYRNGNDPSSNSLTRRFEYWRAGIALFKRSPFFGRGAGNLKAELKTEYAKEGRLSPEAWHLVHNQFLTFLCCFGLIGFLWMLYVHFYPLTLTHIRNEPLYVCFLLVLTASYLAEDTLNTQAGLSFFIFYQGLCVLGVHRPSEITSL